MDALEGLLQRLSVTAGSAPEAPRVERDPRTGFVRRRLPAVEPLSATSSVLLRLGSVCSNRCPMCSDPGADRGLTHAADELLRRADWVRTLGFRHVVLTGGEPLAHPAFWPLVARLTAGGGRFALMTNGRPFAKRGLAARAVAAGLTRVVVSYHTHEPQPFRTLCGGSEAAFRETTTGIRALGRAGADVLLNAVLTGVNVPTLPDYLAVCRERFGRQVAFKFAFPSLFSRARDWAPAELRYDAVRPLVARLQAEARQLGATMLFESFPNCVLGDPTADALSRRAFGTTHYLDDLTGLLVLSVAWADGETHVFGEKCLDCEAFVRCCGVARPYAERHGLRELRPFA